MSIEQKAILAVGLILSAIIGVCGIGLLMCLAIKDVASEIKDWWRDR